MSFYSTPSNDDYLSSFGHDAPANVSAARPRQRNREPSEDEWELILKLPLIHQRKHEGKTGKDLVKWVKQQNFHTTERILMRRMRDIWNIRTSLTNKEELYDRLLQSRAGQAEAPDLDRDQIRRLMRDCGKKRGTSDRYNQLLQLLQQLLRDFPEVLPSDEENSVDHESSSHSGGSPDGFSVQSGSVVLPEFGMLTVSTRSTTTVEGSRATHISDVPWMDTSYVRQPSHLNSADQNAQALFHFSREYYEITIREYHFFHPDLTPPDAELCSNVDPNYIFWWNIKNALYFAKINSHELVKPELDKALKLLPRVLESKHCNILKDLMATLSPIATKRCPLLRQHILKAFRDESARTLGPHHLLSTICRILFDGEGCNDVSLTLLCTMLDKTQQTLPAKDPEVLDLSCTLIAFYRRSKQFEAAEKLADALIEAQVSFYGRNDECTRRALSERVYIYNDQEQYEQALTLAQDIVQQAQSYCGSSFPDMRSIYHMEDLAEIYDRLGETDESTRWLWQAFNGARRMWGDCSSTWHISDKLQRTHGNRTSRPDGVVA